MFIVLTVSEFMYFPREDFFLRLSVTYREDENRLHGCSVFTYLLKKI